MLEWRTVTPSCDRKHMVKGTVLESAIMPGCHSRYLVESVRTYDADRNADAYYRVRDAALVSDAEIREGKPSPIVGTFETLDAALEFINHNSRDG